MRTLSVRRSTHTSRGVPALDSIDSTRRQNRKIKIKSVKIRSSNVYVCVSEIVDFGAVGYCL